MCSFFIGIIVYILCKDFLKIRVVSFVYYKIDFKYYYCVVFRFLFLKYI